MSRLLDDTDDDVPLHTRRGGGDTNGAVGLHDSAADREVTLSTGTVLALFFTLALVCAVFFGFGYSMGRKSAQPVAGDASTTVASPAATSEDTTSTAASTGTDTKPAPGSPAIQPVPGYQSQDEANAASQKSVPGYKPATASTTAAAAPAPAVRKPAAPDAAPAATTETRPAPVVRQAPAPAALAPAPAAAGTVYVQIAAVSHQEDADVLLSALKRRGYQVIARNDLGDRLIHVQIGPFGNRKDAEATRQKLLGDGYNAFLK